MIRLLFHRIIHLGAETSVTGSCHLLQLNGLNLMVDCGLAQGRDSVMGVEKWPVTTKEIDYLFLTHAHIDHIGRLPELIQKDFRGEILCSHPTKALLHPMLSDTMQLSGFSEKSADNLRKVIDDQSWGFEVNETFDLKKGVSFKLKRAGHILGSCFVRVEDGKSGWSVLFSGDLGSVDTPILPDPEQPDTADMVILEATYGDRLHAGRKHRIQQLATILAQALEDGGKVFIPAFSLGRTQELIYEMDRIFSDPEYKQLFPGLQRQKKPPVFIDSPLGLKITECYSRLSSCWNDEAKALYHQGDHPIDFDGLYAVKNHREHLRLCDIQGPAVILAGSGMCTGGRIINHLRKGIGRPENDILFVGYQVPGTLGRAIQKAGQKSGGFVNFDGERKEVKANVHTLKGYSAHADQKGLLDWVSSMPEKPGAIKLVHGNQRSQSALAGQLRRRGYKINL